MSSVALALVSALAYGASDFIGGLVSRRTSPWPVAVVVQGASTVSTVALAVIVGGSPSAADLGWGVVAGLGSGVGVGFLFRGLATGQMSVVAPLSAVGAAVVPVVIGVLTGERPGALATLGIVVALPGIWLVARGESELSAGASPQEARGRGVLDGVLAGIGFGTLFAALGQVSEAAEVWPLAVSQLVSAGAAAVLAVSLRQSLRPLPGVWWAAAAGPLSAIAVVAFLGATQSGLLSVSSVLASLYPAVTVALAMVVLRERVSAGQAGGLVLCALTIALVAGDP